MYFGTSVFRLLMEPILIQISSACLLLWAVFLLLLPLKWLLAVVTAAAIHESFHIAVVWFLGGRVRRIRLNPLGAVIEAEKISGYREAVCALAGPAGSLLLGMLIHWFPLLGLCGLVQCCFNLLPVYPMDGGRVLLCLLEGSWPNCADGIVKAIEITVLLSLFLLAVLLAVKYSLGYFPAFIFLLMTGKALLRKKP